MTLNAENNRSTPPFQKVAFSWAYCAEANEDIPILSAGKRYTGVSRFQRCRGHAKIHRVHDR